MIHFTGASSAVCGEASSALCLFVCSAIRGQETIQGCEGSDDHLFLLHFPFLLENLFSWVCKSCLSKYLFVSSFVLQWNLTVWHFQGSRFGQRMKIFTSFPPWLTNTVRACIQIFYLLATNTTGICKKYVFLLNSFGHRRKIFTCFPPLVDNVWKIWWEHGYKSYKHQTNQYKQYWQTKISPVTLFVI